MKKRLLLTLVITFLAVILPSTNCVFSKTKLSKTKLSLKTGNSFDLKVEGSKGRAKWSIVSGKTSIVLTNKLTKLDVSNNPLLVNLDYAENAGDIVVIK